MNESFNKKDKRRQQIATRLNKLETTLASDRNDFYKTLLHNLQNTLARIQQGTNEDYLSQKAELEDTRDYELTRLRYWEEYQVKRVEDEYKEDISTAKYNHDMIIKLLKEKYYDKLQKQVKQVKEDKLLLNLVNASSWRAGTPQYSSVSALTAAATASSISLTDRRSLRKREMNSRFASGEVDDLSDSGLVSSAPMSHTRSAPNSGHGSSSKRRRHYTTRYSSNDELSSGMASSSHAHGNSAQHNNNGASSGNDSNLSEKDYDTLNNLIMNNEEGGVTKIFANKKAHTTSNSTRASHKQFVGVQGLKPEELSEDLMLLRKAVNFKDEK